MSAWLNRWHNEVILAGITALWIVMMLLEEGTP